ncbi:hypothetical protein, partial [Plasmodium yoelii yoelii]
MCNQKRDTAINMKKGTSHFFI